LSERTDNTPSASVALDNRVYTSLVQQHAQFRQAFSELSGMHVVYAYAVRLRHHPWLPGVMWVEQPLALLPVWIADRIGRLPQAWTFDTVRHLYPTVTAYVSLPGVQPDGFTLTFGKENTMDPKPFYVGEFANTMEDMVKRINELFAEGYVLDSWHPVGMDDGVQADIYFVCRLAPLV
jgi:hypothetical protein